MHSGSNKRGLFARHIAGFAAVAFLLLQFMYGCDYARMKEDEAINTQRAAMPQMPQGTLPVKDGVEALRNANLDDLRNPLPFSKEMIEQGRVGYGYYCAQCHGVRADGNGTVGQSFAPLPTDLSLPYVQDQGDGELFYKISLGFLRHPPLAYTVSEHDRWAIINFIRSLGSTGSKS
jgi:mono/diheme cytochrome c family protein